MNWQPFDYKNKKATAPRHEEPVWITETFYHGGKVIIGYFDGYSFRTWTGTDDCYVTFWAEIEYPKPPAED